MIICRRIRRCSVHAVVDLGGRSMNKWQYSIGSLVFLVASLLCVYSCTRQQPPIKIGLSINLSGLGGAAGEHIRDGALLAVDEVNGAGGIHGRPLELLVRDDQNTDAGIRKTDESLIGEGVVAVFGHSYSLSTVKAYPVVTGHNTLLITAYTATTELSGKDDLFLRTSVDCILYGKKTAALLKKRGIHSVAYLMDMSNSAFVLDYVQQTRKYCSAQSHGVSFDSRSQVEWNRIIHDLLEPDPEAIVFLTEASMTGVALQKLEAAGYTGLRVATTWAQTPGLIRYGGSSTEDLVIVTYVDPDNGRQEYLDFFHAMEKNFQRKATSRSTRAYEIIMILADALKRCPAVNSPELKKALLSQKYETLIGPLQFDQYGDAVRPMYEVVVRDGQFHRHGVL